MLSRQSRGFNGNEYPIFQTLNIEAFFTAQVVHAEMQK